MYSLALSKLSFPLHKTHLFISAYHALIVLGFCNVKGDYENFFEFQLSTLNHLYPSFIEWLKHFSQSDPHSVLKDSDLIINKEENISYGWKKKLINDQITIALMLEKDGALKLEIVFNYDDFNKLLQSLYFLTWRTLCLTDVQLSPLILLMSLPFTELYELRKPEKLVIYLKSIRKNPHSYSAIILFYIETIFFQHKIKRMINYEAFESNMKFLKAI